MIGNREFLVCASASAGPAFEGAGAASGNMAIARSTGDLAPLVQEGTPISEITANQRITSFCRTCQPGGLIRGMGSR